MIPKDRFGNKRNAAYRRADFEICSRCIGAFGLVHCAICGGYGEAPRVLALHTAGEIKASEDLFDQ